MQKKNKNRTVITEKNVKLKKNLLQITIRPTKSLNKSVDI